MDQGTGKGHRQRLRERFLTGEDAARTDELLLELLLTYAIPQKDVRPLAGRLLATFGDLARVLGADLPALCTVEGVGEYAATLLRLTACIAQQDSSPTAPSPHRTASAFSAAPVVAPVPEETTGSEPCVPISAPEIVPAVAAPVEGRSHADVVRWRATGPYTAANASKAGLLEETRLMLVTDARLQDRAASRRELVDGALPQRSRATRETIVGIIRDRLLAWNPPDWVWADLVDTALLADDTDLRLLLLLHTVRQDSLLYDIMQQVVWPTYQDGRSTLSRVDVQRFLDQALPHHPEIDGWSVATRNKLAGNLLTIVRDYGLLQGDQGSTTKRIVEPVVSLRSAAHLARLLTEEGVEPADLAAHDDWRIWLLDPTRAQALLDTIKKGGAA